MSAGVGVCIPTLNRPRSVEAVLRSVAEQSVAPSAVIVVDAGTDGATPDVCRRMSDLFAPGVLRHVPAERGLPKQRCVGIKILRDLGLPYICMLDDDVTLARDFLAETVGFLESEEGEGFGGVSGYLPGQWGLPFERLERIYSRMRIYEGELRPGRWLYCGQTLPLNRIERNDRVTRVELLPGCQAVWRSSVFDHFLPPAELEGYALAEDLHLALRVSSRFALGVTGRTEVWHHHAPGGRPRRVRMGFLAVRRSALLLRDCSPRPTIMRYLVFVAFTFFDLIVRIGASILLLRPKALPQLFGSMVGWLSCVVAPPRRTSDALSLNVDSRIELARSEDP